MCGRYVFYDPQELSEHLANVSLDAAFFERFNPTWNAAPSQDLPVIVEDDTTINLRAMSWGLIPRWTKPGERPKIAPINARSETIAEKPMFRSLLKSHRCVAPANAFYEWKRTASGKQPYIIEPESGQLMLFAGLYDVARHENGDPRPSFTIVTTRANGTMESLHHRMPVILSDAAAEIWLDPDLDEIEPLEHLLVPAPDTAISVRPVGKEVNNTRNNGPDLIEPLDAESDDGA